MKRIIVLILFLANNSLYTRKCPNPSWRTQDECKADEGNWVDESGYSCEAIKNWDPQPEGTVCCAGCTDDGLEEMGMD